MTPEDLVEKVALAMREAWRDREELRRVTLEWPDIGPEEREAYMADARAALRVVREALAEPTQEMQVAGGNALGGWVAPALHADDAWRAMLDASPLGRIA